jgi:hypothetical protein
MKRLPTPTKYPKKLHVRQEIYRVIFTSRLDKDTLGITDSGDRTIRIKLGMSRRQTFRTFIHEVLHALEFEFGIKIKHKSVYKYSKAIHHLLVDNFL